MERVRLKGLKFSNAQYNSTYALLLDDWDDSKLIRVRLEKDWGVMLLINTSHMDRGPGSAWMG